MSVFRVYSQGKCVCETSGKEDDAYQRAVFYAKQHRHKGDVDIVEVLEAKVTTLMEEDEDDPDFRG